MRAEEVEEAIGRLKRGKVAEEVEVSQYGFGREKDIRKNKRSDAGDVQGIRGVDKEEVA